ncbi:MAG: peroxiredoxin family protein [Planctomycetota bacterium]
MSASSLGSPYGRRWLGALLWVTLAGCSAAREETPAPEVGAPKTAVTPATPEPARSIPAAKLVAPTPKNLTTPPAPSATPTPNGAAAELAEILQAYESSQLDYASRAAAAKPGLEALAAKYPGTEEALTAQLRLLGFTWWERERGTMHESAGVVVDAIIADYPRSPRLAELTHYAYVFSSEQRTQYFEPLTRSPHPEVRAAAEYELARSALRSKDETVKTAAQTRLARLRSEYADLPFKYTTYGEMAEAHLAPHDSTALAIGSIAPEILGKDLYGQPMKLSDYRGKVVVLDFWGDW